MGGLSTAPAAEEDVPEEREEPTPDLLRRAGRAVLLVFALVSASGTAVFVSGSPPEVTTPEVAGAAVPDGDAPIDLARVDRGARVRVSSWHLHGRHHPLFAIDGQPRPTPLERWVPDPSDAAPWIEVLLPRPSRVQEITLAFGIAGSAAEHGSPAYELSCLAGEEARETWTGRSAHRDRVAHPVEDGACDGVDALRVELRRGVPPAHLYEIGARGR